MEKLTKAFFLPLKKDLRQILLIMRLTVILLILGMSQISASVYSQKQKVSLKFENISLQKLIWEIEKQTDFVFMYGEEDIKNVTNLNVDVNDANVMGILNELLENTDVEVELVDEVVVMMKKKENFNSQELTNIEITGKVIDEKGEPIPGATVMIKGTRVGMTTDVNGTFKLKVPNKTSIIKISFVGYETNEFTVNNKTTFNIVLKEKIEELGEVVISTGYIDRKKETFTGAATTISGAEILKISTTNIFKTLAIVDPAIEIRESNIQGSNPNYIPELIIRGTTSINTANEIGVNSPLIVIDGIESSIRALYDMDIFDIEKVTVLKDASATALYGEQAANGVILVDRKKSSQKEVRVSYNLSGNVTFPDLSDYSLMNAKQKLELERLSGLYESSIGAYDEIYNERLAKVNSGINTDWIAKPLRTGFSQNHSLNVSGRGSGMSYGLTARYGNTKGVMKDDLRRNMGLGIYLSYNYKRKVIVSFTANFSQNNSLNSKYGSFGNYTKLNPYDAPYDVNGDLIKVLSYNIRNPLYEASLASFNKSKTKSLNASLNLRWNILKGLYATAAGNISASDKRSDIYISPDSPTFIDDENQINKGSYSISASNQNNYYLKAGINFNRNLDSDGSMISMRAGGEIRKSNNYPYGFKAEGFFNDMLIDPTFAAGFPDGGKPSGVSSESARLGFYGSSTLTYKNRYFCEGSYRASGSSKFGRNKRYAPFWSLGLGWNLHKEDFMQHDWINILRLRTSYGHTGSVNFSSYQAITTYKYASSLINLYGLGANPITMGNEDLTWQTTKEWNLGLNASLFENRLDLTFDIYSKKTVDMIVPISMPPSTGVTTVSNNVGKQQNKGFEFSISAMVIKKSDMNWRVRFNVSRNRTTLLEIGNALKNQNDEAAFTNSNSPLRMFVEGESSSMLYVVPSAGIDPASGKEIYIKKDGAYTYIYDPRDKVAVGDASPEFRGSVSSFFTYKRFTIGLNFSYSVGGYIYNSSRVSRIERINPQFNADERAYTERWKAPGDVVHYLSIIGTNYNNYHSSRFVEKESYLQLSNTSISYQFDKKLVEKLGFKRLSIGISASNLLRLSTVIQERGLSYPFSRGFSFTISSTF